MPRLTPTHHSLATEARVRRGYFEFRYGQLHVHTAIPPGGGFEEGTPLVCLHGSPGSGRVFADFLALAGRDRSVYAPDLPGCGESDPLPRAAGIADYALAIGDFLDDMHLRQLDVLGHGAGAVLATELALTRPGQVRRLIMVSVPLSADGTREAARRGAAMGLAGAAAQYPLRERLARIPQELLVVRPRDGWWDAVPAVREALPGARLVELPEQGADVFGSAPGRVAEAVREFLRR